MGKIKTKTIKRTSNSLVKEGLEFSTTFEKNKKILGNTMPSKRIRNQMAGYLARLKQQEEKQKKQLNLGK